MVVPTPTVWPLQLQLGKCLIDSAISGVVVDAVAPHVGVSLAVNTENPRSYWPQPLEVAVVSIVRVLSTVARQ